MRLISKGGLVAGGWRSRAPARPAGPGTSNAVAAKCTGKDALAEDVDSPPDGAIPAIAAAIAATTPGGAR